MEANELRIGNYVFYDSEMKIGKYVKVATIENTGIRVFNGIETQEGRVLTNVIPYDEIQFISLTEEWLLKFGIKKDWHSYPFPGMDGVYLGDDDSEMDLKKFPVCGDYDAYVYIKMPEYVHQLQNLYFALTGKELELTK